MPRSSDSRVVTEMPQRQSPLTSDRSPKLGRSLRGTQSADPLNQKRLGTRIADLESQLGQAQEELKCLKDQLSSAEPAKKAAQEQLDKRTKKPTCPMKKPKHWVRTTDTTTSVSPTCEIVNENQQATDVYEVPVEPDDVKAVDDSSSPQERPEKASVAVDIDELQLVLMAKLEAKEKELESFLHENEHLKTQLSEKFVELSAARVKDEEMSSRLNRVEQELETSKTEAAEMNRKLEASEKAKLELETEMKKLRVQTEQWRKAADAAAAVLAGGVEMNGRRLSERCGSMEQQHYANFFEPPQPIVSSYIGLGDRDGDYSDDVYGSGKRKGGSGIRMFVDDLWKRKGHK